MNTFTKKRSYFLSLMVSVFVLTLSSTAWSQTGGRLLSFIADSYILNVALDQIAVQNYLDDEINPTVEAHGQAPLTSYLGLGQVVIHSRNNLRDDGGVPIDSGEDCAVILLLLVRDPAAPPPYISVLLIESFNSNQAIIDYIAGQGLRHPQEPSEVKKTQQIKSGEKGSKIKDLFDVRDQRGIISLKTNFVAPEPSFHPPEVSDFVAETPYRLRFSYAAERLFSMSYSRAVYEPLVDDSLLYFKIDGLAGSAGELFNGLDKKDVTRLRFMHQAQVIDENL